MTKRTRLFANIAGWYGLSAVLLAYALVNLGVIEPQNMWNLLLNLTGAIGIIIVSIVQRVRQLVVLNIIWALVALLSLMRAAIGA